MDKITTQLATTFGQGDELERPQGPSLTAAELQPADVLLSRGIGPISDAIVAADRAAYSHAALWSGDAIIEAKMKGGVAENVPDGERYVYRHSPLLEPLKAGQIVAAARTHVGNSYATAEIHLLAVVFKKWGLQERPRRSLASSLLSILGGPAAPRLEFWLQERYAQSAPRICSELVALAYYTAELPLRLLAPAERLQASGSSEADIEETEEPASGADLEQLESSINSKLYGVALVERVASERSISTKDAKGILFGHLAIDFNMGTPVDIVTPGDLQFCPSLKFVGKMSF